LRSAPVESDERRLMEMFLLPAGLPARKLRKKGAGF
jgi:hypothetical protein